MKVACLDLEQQLIEPKKFVILKISIVHHIQ